MKKLLLCTLFGLPLLLLPGAPAAADSPPPAAVNVVISDSGVNPPAVTILPGGSVTWINQGSNVHTASSIGGAPLPFNTGGMAPGQSVMFTFGIPGKYYYSSATDCLDGNNKPPFPCDISFLITVTSAEVVATSAAATAASLPPTWTPTATPVPANLPAPIAIVTITDQGILPATVTIALNGSVRWVNNGSTVHTATSPGTSTWMGFDTGGLAQGQLGNVGFSTPGTFTYTSAPDCLNGSSNPNFKCGPYTVIVSAVALPGPSTPPTPAPTPIPALAAPASNTTVTIDDVSGYQPSMLTIKAGQIVTWTNKGANVHTVSSNSGYIPAFDSGGLGGGQSFSVTFPIPGSYGYHSQTDVTYSNDAGCACVIPVYSFNGTINVTS